jgi:hypothetical protein
MVSSLQILSSDFLAIFLGILGNDNDGHKKRPVSFRQVDGQGTQINSGDSMNPFMRIGIDHLAADDSAREDFRFTASFLTCISRIFIIP